MQQILEEDPTRIERSQVTSQSDLSRTLPLHHAVRANHSDCTIFLLDFGAHPDSLDPSGHTALELAIVFSLDGMVEILLENGASPNYLWHNCTRTKYLELAVERRLNNIVKLLLEHNADTEDYEINEKGEKHLKVNYESPLINALWEENTEVFKLLLFHSSSLECYNDNNSIPHIIIASYISASETMDALKAYKEFGGNLWVLQPDLEDRTDVPETALQSLRRKPCLYQFTGEPENIDYEIETLMNTPLTLQSLSRIVILKSIGRNYWRRVSSLPLPTQIIKFLKFHDIFKFDNKTIIKNDSKI
jgi:ankyrin repeat protein